jgi:dTDP-4-dehydrorhamnose 3,5-epimerase
MEPLGIEGAWATTRPVHEDNRGSFREWFRFEEFTGATGYRFQLAQANCSVSHQRVIRGVHFADVPPGQAKYVACADGVVLDVIVDVRVGSPTFGKWVAEKLDTGGRSVFLSEGLGHAWTPLTPSATMIYLCSEPYAPASERAVNPLDPAIGIDWPMVAPFLSPKDNKAPSLAEAERQGILPDYDACMKYRAGLRDD